MNALQRLYSDVFDPRHLPRMCLNRRGEDCGEGFKCPGTWPTVVLAPNLLHRGHGDSEGRHLSTIVQCVTSARAISSTCSSVICSAPYAGSRRRAMMVRVSANRRATVGRGDGCLAG